jgi:hypothetical protein
MGNLNNTLNSEFEIITEKLPNIEKDFDNHMKIKTGSDIKLAELKAMLTTFNARQVIIEHRMNNSMAIQDKLESNKNLLPEGTHNQSVGQAADSRVAFLVQRTTGFNSQGSIITYQKNALNLGKAFDMPTGLFHVPVAGVYHFYFAGINIVY